MPPEADDRTHESRTDLIATWRLGARAMGLDALAGALALVAAYLVELGQAGAWQALSTHRGVLALLVGLQVATMAAMGLYQRRGQLLWPPRLATGAIGGALGAWLVAVAVGRAQAVVPEAWAGQVALLGLGAVLWRTVVALKHRQQYVRRMAERYGGQALAIQGEHVGSMMGSIARTWRYRHLLRNLVVKDLKLKYQRSLLGFAWSLLNPLLMIAVYTVAFTVVLRLPTVRFALFILIGLLAWTFFAGSVTSATDAVSGQGSLIRSVVFPRVVLPFAAVLFHFTQYVLTVAVFLPVMLLFYGVTPDVRMLLFPIFLVLQLVFTAGVALVLSTAAVAYRDVRHLVEVGIGIGFWATPIVYEPTMVPEPFRQLALLSPVASYIRAYQDLFYYETTPELAIWVVAGAYALGAFVCGLSVFLAYEARMPELA